MAWLSHVFEGHPAFEVDPDEKPIPGRHRRRRLKPGTDVGRLRFDRLRHAAVATASYGEFKRQQQLGFVPQRAKFLFPLATPLCFSVSHLRESDQAVVEEAYETALCAEIRTIVAAIPSHELAIQWDAPVETWPIDRGTPMPFGRTREEMLRAVIPRLIRIGQAVPEGVDLIYHFCYGDPGHKHMFEPTDMSIMVGLANGIAAGIARSVQLYHFPVPVDRDDDAYFTPLGGLGISAQSEVCLGVVHHADGAAGARRRMEVANRHLRATWHNYWIGTECGMGRRDPATIARLLEIHAEVADLP